MNVVLFYLIIFILSYCFCGILTFIYLCNNHHDIVMKENKRIYGKMYDDHDKAQKDIELKLKTGDISHYFLISLIWPVIVFLFIVSASFKSICMFKKKILENCLKIMEGNRVNRIIAKENRIKKKINKEIDNIK